MKFATQLLDISSHWFSLYDTRHLRVWCCVGGRTGIRWFCDAKIEWKNKRKITSTRDFRAEINVVTIIEVDSNSVLSQPCFVRTHPVPSFFFQLNFQFFVNIPRDMTNRKCTRQCATIIIGEKLSHYGSLVGAKFFFFPSSFSACRGRRVRFSYSPFYPCNGTSMLKFVFIGYHSFTSYSVRITYSYYMACIECIRRVKYTVYTLRAIRITAKI